jgi:Uma2 family endonuclease
VAVETEILEMHRWTLDEYHQLIESGGFDEGMRVELIDGFLLDMSPRTGPHDNAIARLDEVLQHTVDLDRFVVRTGMALTISNSEPEPDVAVVERSTPRPYHPATAELVIEVSVSSLRRDLQKKPALYARAGIPLYWVIDLDGRRAVVHTDPGIDGYGNVQMVRDGGVLTATHIGVAGVALADVLAATGL